MITQTKQQEPQKGTVTSLIDWLHEKHIYDLAVTRMTAFERLENRRRRNVVDVLSESMTEMVKAIQNLATKQAREEMSVASEVR
jgi:hypothetical protein